MPNPGLRIAALAMVVCVSCSDSKDPGRNGEPSDDTATGTVIGGCQILPTNHVFNSRIDDLPVHPQSAAFLNTIGERRVHLDLGLEENPASDEYYGIPFNVVDGSAMTWKRVVYGDADMAEESDCAVSESNTAIARPCPSNTAYFPIPSAPLVEGGLQASFPADSDHHLLIIDSNTCVLWELGEAVKPSAGWRSNWSAAFDLGSNALRPADWTSADAAGFPILPLLLRATEASTGEIHHAFRFTINTNKIRTSYVWPARHRTRNGTDSASLPQMGQLFRLKASVEPPEGAGPQARAIITALKQYGMYVADGGSDMYITGTPDADWAEDTFDVVQDLSTSDFEAVDIASVFDHAEFDVDSGALPR